MLQDDGPIDWLEVAARALSSLGEYFNFVRESLLGGNPITPADILNILFGNVLANQLNEWFMNFRTWGTQEEMLVSSFFYVSAAIAALILMINVSIYIFKALRANVQAGAGKFLRGSASVKKPQIFFPQAILAQVVNIALPSTALFLMYLIRVKLSEAALAVYQPQTIGNVFADLITSMLTSKGILWFAATFPFILFFLGIFLLFLVGIYLWVWYITLWGLVQNARFAGSDRMGIVLADVIYSFSKPFVVLILITVIFWLGPGLLANKFFGWLPAAIGLMAWILSMITFPAVMIRWGFPRYEKQALMVIHKLQNAFAPGDYDPRQWIFDPVNKSPRELDVRKGVDTTISTAKKALNTYADYKTHGVTKLIRDKINERLRRG
jgi:hypothetical protein